MKTKEVFRKAIRFIWNLIFKKQNVKFEKPQLEFRHEEPKPIRKSIGKGRAHKNNRKQTRGRRTQYIKMNDSSVRFIFHEAF